MPATLTQLRTRAKRLADMEGSSFVADAEWLDLINEGLAELHDIFVTKYEDYFLTSQAITLVAGTHSYALPSGYYKTRGVDLVSGGQSYTLRPFEFRERNRAQGQMVVDGADYQYQIVGLNMRFVPTPQAAGTVTHWYVPSVTQLASASDEISAAYPTGSERYVVTYAAAKALIKEQSDPSALMADLVALKAKIEGAAGNRDAGEPRRVVDVRNHLDIWWR